MPRRRYELTDEQYERTEHLLPEVEGRGCPYNDHREVMGGIFWILRSGAPWRDMPERQGATGRLFMTGSDAGPKMAPLSRLHGTCRVNSTPRDLSTGASWARTAPSFKQPRPPLVGRTIVKRGPNQARRRNRTCPWLWTCRSCEAGSSPRSTCLQTGKAFHWEQCCRPVSATSQPSSPT